MASSRVVRRIVHVFSLSFSRLLLQDASALCQTIAAVIVSARKSIFAKKSLYTTDLIVRSVSFLRILQLHRHGLFQFLYYVKIWTGDEGNIVFLSDCSYIRYSSSMIVCV